MKSIINVRVPTAARHIRFLLVGASLCGVVVWGSSVLLRGIVRSLLVFKHVCAGGGGGGGYCRNRTVLYIYSVIVVGFVYCS